MSDMLAAFLWGQLELCAEIKEKRKFVYEAYTAIIKDTALRHTVIPQGSDPSYHLFYVILPQGCDRMAVMSGMKDNGVQTAFHYVPLHTSPVGLSLGGKVGTLPVTEDLSTRLLRLPLYPGLNADDVQKITEVLMDALSKYSG